MLMSTNNCKNFLSIPDEVLESGLASDGITSVLRPELLGLPRFELPCLELFFWNSREIYSFDMCRIIWLSRTWFTL